MLTWNFLGCIWNQTHAHACIHSYREIKNPSPSMDTVRKEAAQRMIITQRFSRYGPHLISHTLPHLPCTLCISPKTTWTLKARGLGTDFSFSPWPIQPTLAFYPTWRNRGQASRQAGILISPEGIRHSFLAAPLIHVKHIVHSKLLLLISLLLCPPTITILTLYFLKTEVLFIYFSISSTGVQTRWKKGSKIKILLGIFSL